VDRVTEIAQEKGVKPSQLALAWVLAQNEHSVPIPGTTRREHLQANIAALEVTLTSEDLARIEAVAPAGAVIDSDAVAGLGVDPGTFAYVHPSPA
jgi:aryl-alcohol dehydrogenase-like predicted oxidoreductase